MGRKIFVSYKYWDSKVQCLGLNVQTTARHYVDELQGLLEEHGHINKGEQDGDSLADFRDSTIETKLRDKIYDSSITIVLISKAMKSSDPEADQWIPWEIAYSLKEHSRNGIVSRSNAILGVVLPDETGSYAYYIEDDSCKHCKSRTLKTHILFEVLKENMFNSKSPEHVSCSSHAGGGTVYTGNHSYIPSIKWSEFCVDVKKYIELAELINENIKDYSLRKEV